jgi:pantoate--beta-alanine ligase
LENIMEGLHRPGHFNGVAQVVSKLLQMIKPDKAYFGLKDFQQLAIIKKLKEMLQLPSEIVPCSIVREKDGLAMSSRNKLLSPEERKNAALIYKVLREAKNHTGKKSVEELTEWVIKNINKNPFLDVEYFEIVDNEKLLPVKSWQENSQKTGCIAVFCGKIRLIDNIVLN